MSAPCQRLCQRARPPAAIPPLVAATDHMDAARRPGQESARRASRARARVRDGAVGSRCRRRRLRQRPGAGARVLLQERRQAEATSDEDVRVLSDALLEGGDGPFDAVALRLAGACHCRRHVLIDEVAELACHAELATFRRARVGARPAQPHGVVAGADGGDAPAAVQGRRAQRVARPLARLPSGAGLAQPRPIRHARYRARAELGARALARVP
mmetsp:Transcript_19972/g.56678  ORF Transcript_19972/g.56678 Transcript_19972/m.56678 type:complete len:214 (+) Transcript_19972:61-702(+)